MTVSAFPLSWPPTIPRTKNRETGQFRTSIGGALHNVEDSLRLFAKDSTKPIKNVVISSNVSLGVTRPEDPGIAVWFVWDSMSVCIPVDRYTKPEANLQAIHHVIEARRVELRHGTLALVRASLTGFIALPGAARKRTWREVLAFKAEQKIARDDVIERYRHMAKSAHSDRGGTDAAMAELNIARDEALRELEVEP